jgi:CDP-glycerol glycerophosphotransferase (TagB/SpsB family)
VDDGRRYDPVRGRYPELLYAEPRWIHDGSGDWSRVVPLPEDVAFLADLVRHSDLNVNVASTMTLDFAVRDKPVVNVAFDVADPPPFAVPLWEHYYRFEHYRPVVELGAARFARSAEELARHVNAYLADPALDRDARRRLVELEIGVPPEDSSERILDVLEEIGA